MRSLVVLIALGGVAHADPGDTEIAKGAAFATQGQFKDAIIQFKAALAIAPTRPEPECLIALAYRRLERWGQATLFLTRCQTHAQQPEWMPQLASDVAAGLAHASLTPVTFAIQPASAVASINVASFAQDEQFAPQKIWLEQGKQLVTITAPGYKPAQLAIDLPTPAPYEVKVALERDHSAPLPMRRHEPTAQTSWLTGKRVLIGSGVVIAIGGVFHIAAAITRSDMEQDVATYNRQRGTFVDERAIVIGAYAIGAIGAGIGLWMMHGESPITAQVDSHGAGLAWSGSW